VTGLVREIEAARRRRPGPLADLAGATAAGLGSAAAEMERLAAVMAAARDPAEVRAGALRAAALALAAEHAARAGRLALLAAIPDG
jgi:hypothetical protein